jgi:hypothetical protein
MFKPEPGLRYDMPVVFGPSSVGAKAHFREIRNITHRFLTDPSALEPLVPYHFSLAEPAVVNVASNIHVGVDWLAGRNYNTAFASIEVRAKDGDKDLRGTYVLVQWEAGPHLVFAAREFLGVAKLSGEIPDHERGPDTAAFECSEYGTRMFRVEVTDLTPVDVPNAEGLHEAGGFGWKYITGPGGIVDADYPTKQVSRTKLLSKWTGASSLVWDQPTWEQCPLSCRFVERLGALPVLEVLPASVSIMTGMFDRDACSRLSAANDR